MALPEILTRKIGPLPGWAWGGLTIGSLLLITTWRSNKKASAESGVTQSYGLPETLQPTYVIRNENYHFGGGGHRPPMGGRPGPPKSDEPPPPPTPDPPAPTPDPPKPPPSVPTPAPAPKGKWVTVVPFKSGRKAGTPDSLWGIAESVYGVKNGHLWAKIWNAPQNAALRAKRKSTSAIQAGDKFWVPL